MPLDPQVRDSIRTLLSEIVNGPPPGQEAFMVNPGDPGLLGSLERLSAPEASARPNGRASVAAHADHVRYGLELLNRSLREPNVFAAADWSASWSRHTVNEPEWRERRDALEHEAQAWLNSVDARDRWEPIVLTGTIASVAHIAYHLGAIRQLVPKAAGPPEGATR